MKKEDQEYLIIGGGLLAAYFLFFKKTTVTPLPVSTALPSGTIQNTLPTSSSAITQATAAVPALTSIWTSLFGGSSSTPATTASTSPVINYGTSYDTPVTLDTSTNDLGLPSGTDCLLGCDDNSSFLAGIGVIH